jgi:hypothetical protein
VSTTAIIDVNRAFAFREAMVRAMNACAKAYARQMCPRRQAHS